MAIVLGIAALVALVVGVGLVLVLGTRQAREEQEPPSHPGDFVAPVSSGGYRFRGPDESLEQFHARVTHDGAAGQAASAGTEAAKKR